MPSVGPELPSYLTKRKRSVNEDESPNSPPRKVQAASPRSVGPILPVTKNPDEVDIEDNSDDDYGPSVPTIDSAKRFAVGLTLPSAKNPDEVELEDESEDDYGPTLPTTKVTAEPRLPSSKNPDELDKTESSEDDDYGPSAPNPTQTSKPSIGPSIPPKRVLGPAPPPANLSEMPSHPATSDSDSSDDDYGPSLPPAPGSAAALLVQSQQEQERAARVTPSSTPSKPQRAEWMLAPPTDSDWTSRIDPTKLKNRKFASGKGAKAPAAKSGVSAIWTETPEEKRQRLEDEVMGRSEGSSAVPKANKNVRGEDKEQAETERRIREYNEKNRGRSLMEERRAAQERGVLEKEEEDDPSKRGFDREKDMALGGRMGEAKKREMLGRAADFGSRFQRGKYL